MSRKLFLRSAKDFWQTHYPFLTPVSGKVGSKTPEGAIFAVARQPEMIYLFFQFSSVYSGRVTINVTVSDVEGDFVASPRSKIVKPLPVGTYRVSRFWGEADYWWALEDESKMFQALGAAQEAFNLSSIPNEKIWTPKYYSATATVISEALKNIDTKLKQFVFPVLELS